MTARRDYPYERNPPEQGDKEMLVVFTMNWWALAIRGALAVAFGMIAFLMPEITLTVLVLLFGAYATADGIFAIIAAIRASGRVKRWWALLLEGVLGVVAGVLTFVLPGITALVLLYLIAFWAILTGIVEIGVAIRLRKEIAGEWLMAMGGIASVLFGSLLVLFPGAGAVAVVWWVGAYAVLFGAVLLALGFRLRNWEKSLVKGEPRLA
jgi:uncharacterized membrane protein HdeD (DUF308 family)